MTNDKLDLTYYGGQDLYSDGDIETEMLEIFDQEKDIQHILENSNDWALLYHLSDMRHTVLDWLPVEEGSTVLEIGAGCGAITGLLCKKFEKVVCVELSKRRSMINASRNKGFDNLQIMVGNFQDIQITEKFDYVTLIGVLEYSASYMGSEKPYEDMLKRVKNYLKPDGKLIIAIENRNGLKYWSGASEDHTGGWFDGIEEYRKHDWIKTFDRQELTALLEKCGYQKNEFYYPVPDYKMPRAVYSDDFLPGMGDLRGMDIAFDRPRYKLFEDDVVFDSLCKSGKFPEYANSFLVIAGSEDEKNGKKVLFSKYNRARKPEFRLATTIYEENGLRWVEKKALCPEAENHIRSLLPKAEAQQNEMKDIQVLQPSVEGDTATYSFIEGLNMEQQLQSVLDSPETLITEMKALNHKLEQACEGHFTEFHMTDQIRSVFGEVPEAGQKAVPMLGIDLLYDNLMKNDEELICLDCEWVLEDPVPFRFLVYRQIFYFYFRYRFYLEPRISMGEFLGRFGFEDKEITLYKEMEANFQQFVQGEGYRYSVTNNYVRTIQKNVFEQIQELEALSSERLEICMERLKLIRHHEGVEAVQNAEIQKLRTELEETKALLKKQEARLAAYEEKKAEAKEDSPKRAKLFSLKRQDKKNRK